MFKSKESLLDAIKAKVSPNVSNVDMVRSEKSIYATIDGNNFKISIDGYADQVEPDGCLRGSDLAREIETKLKS